MSESTTIQYERGDDGIVVLTLDDPNQSANTMNEAYVRSMGETVDRLASEVESGRRQGRDPHLREEDLLRRRRPQRPDQGRRPRTPAESRPASPLVKAQLRRLETLGVPVVACVNGAALGGGLEICLATPPPDRRRQPEDPARLPRGPARPAARRRRRRPHGPHARPRRRADEGADGGQARTTPRRRTEIGIVDEIVATPDDLIPAAKKWIAENPEAKQPWDADGYKMPGGKPIAPGAGAEPAGVPGEPAQAAQGRQLPGSAPHHGRGRRGCADRRRQRVRDRGPVLHRPRLRPGRRRT